MLLTSLILISHVTLSSSLTVEELRIEKIKKSHPTILAVFSKEISQFKRNWANTTSYQDAKELIRLYSDQLWQDAKRQISSSKSMDDRPLYWARLQSSKIIRLEPTTFSLTLAQQQVLLSMLEHGSRGKADLAFSQGAVKKIILTGFDPFLLDRNINQSNPSGVAALMLDGKVITHKGVTAEINTVMVPVIYHDFDKGIIEALLAPYYALNNVDMVVTVSMGRKDFDLERFPGKRRSVTAPDNININSGGTREKPIIPRLNNIPLPGSEFVEFSLPVKAMQLAKGPYKVIDNHQVTTLKQGDYLPSTIENLKNEVAVSGSGGGYLSNEISYRSIRLRNELNSKIPTGHIHTPRIQQFDPEVEQKIVVQIQAMLEQAIITL